MSFNADGSAKIDGISGQAISNKASDAPKVKGQGQQIQPIMVPVSRRISQNGPGTAQDTPNMFNAFGGSTLKSSSPATAGIPPSLKNTIGKNDHATKSTLPQANTIKNTKEEDKTQTQVTETQNIEKQDTEGSQFIKNQKKSGTLDENDLKADMKNFEDFSKANNMLVRYDTNGSSIINIDQLTNERLTGYPNPKLYDQFYINKYSFPKGLSTIYKSDEERNAKQAFK